MVNTREKTYKVWVDDVCIGGKEPVVIQSMTDTDTANIEATVEQVMMLARAGSALVRITVNNKAAAKAVPYIREQLNTRSCFTPLIGDFHYNGHLLLTMFPDMAQSLSKYRINPGNTGTRGRDNNFCTIIEQALRYNKPVRIGVNWGSLDKQLLTGLMNKNAASRNPKGASEILEEALVESAVSFWKTG